MFIRILKVSSILILSLLLFKRNVEASNVLLKTSLECLHCKGPNCDEPKSIICKNASPDDQCFILFNTQNDIIEMGCISDQDDNFINNNIHSLFMCNNDNNCNDFINIPKPNICLQCNSLNNTDCASQPENVQDEELCKTLPNTQCFININSDGSTERGCASDLNHKDLLACLNGNSSNCFICGTNKCNQKLFPDTRRSCHRCNSKDNANCEISPAAASICSIYSDAQFCATKLVNGHTYRGCSTEFQCDSTDKQYCRLCYDTDNCNVETLKDNNIGYPGKWQTSLPISCYSCKGSECLNTNDEMKKQCQGSGLQNCVTVFNETGPVIERGCSDEIYNNPIGNYCDQNPKYCKFCKSNNCNSANSLNNYTDCLFCDGNEDKNCVLNVHNIQQTRSCHGGCITALYPRSAEENPAYDLIRSCLDDLEEADRNKCSFNETYCQTCTNHLCNKVNLGERLKCYTCEGEECEVPTSSECPSFREHDHCFILFNAEENNIVQMGCGSDVDTDFFNTNRRQLFLCEGKNCNDVKNMPSIHSCQSCDSHTEPDCATGYSQKLKQCPKLPHTECYTRLDEDGITHRGCLADLTDDIFYDCIATSSSNRTCEICESNNCNSEVYPKGRRSCYRCDSLSYAACENNPSSFSGICPTYNENDACVTTLEGDRTRRGCTSEIICDPSKRDSCRLCNGTNDCNAVNLRAASIGPPGRWQNVPLSCLLCEGRGCENSNNVTTQKCEGNSLQTCLTVFELNGNVAMRGCSDTVAQLYGDYCDINQDYCMACKSTHCNNAQNLQDYVDCYFCDSQNNPFCTQNFSGQGTQMRKCQKSCMVALYPRNNSTDSAYELTRSCLDDLEIDDRDKCDRKVNPYCVPCQDAKCNSMNLPEVRHECYHCANSTCEDVITSTCKLFHPNEQCYILFDNENSIQNVGCRSDFSSGITDLIKKKKLLLCDDINCNSLDVIPTAKMCTTCNSKEEPLCATNPNLIVRTKRCAILPYTDCYTRINKEGHTERGCLSSLDDNHFFDCLMGNDTLCENCFGEQCNKNDIFPVDRLKCHQCNSLNNSQCTTDPDSIEICPIYKRGDKCLTNFRNGITTRGCASSMNCDNENNKLTCQVCNTNGCNTMNLEKINAEGIPGKWQDIPLTCYTCKNREECQDKGVFRPCLNNPFQNCMTIFSKDGFVIRRGCSDIVKSEYDAYCHNNPEKCMHCNSNGCNLAKSLNEYIECLSCDSNFNSNCIDNVNSVNQTRMCYKYCMSALYPRSNETDPSYGLSRSCYDDMDQEDRENCVDDKNNFCRACNQPKCNTVAMPEMRLSCYVCNGDDCQHPKTEMCRNYRFFDKCYIRYDENHAIMSMGCRSEFSNWEADQLLKQKLLLLCDSDNCNSYENLPSIQQCALCNSRTDNNCSISPSDVKSKTSCRLMPYTQCYTRILTDGATERGCLSDLHDDDFVTCLNGNSSKCESCQGDNCNLNIYPSDRLKCHQCSSENDPLCTTAPNSNKPCLHYKANDSCVTHLHNAVTTRDCASSLQCNDEDNKESCQTCSFDGCNTIDLENVLSEGLPGKWQDIPLTCYTCKNREECQDKGVFRPCLNNPFQNCMTVFSKDGFVIRRGCSDIVKSEYDAYCHNNPEKCMHCNSNGCNLAKSLNEYIECLSCDSNFNSNCIDNVNSVNQTRMCYKYCMSALYPRSNETDPSYGLSRSCYDDMDQEDRENCVDDKNNFCRACNQPKCNTVAMPEMRLSCYVCNGDDCQHPKTEMCRNYRFFDKCYIRYDENHAIMSMGCRSEFSNWEADQLLKQKLLLLCDSDNCNSYENLPSIQQCALCNSRTDNNCSISPSDVKSKTSCRLMPYTQCYTRILTDGATERGCLSDLHDDDFVTCLNGNSSTCESCQGDNCNLNIYPSDRLKCHQCSSENDPLCTTAPNSNKPCLHYKANDSCVTHLHNAVTTRDCASSLQCNDEDNKESCQTCSFDGCNTIDLENVLSEGLPGKWQDIPLTCYTCKNREECQDKGVFRPCLNNPFQNCMTVFSKDGFVIRRGCSDIVKSEYDSYCHNNPEKCMHCNSNGCNLAKSLNEYIECLSCDSNFNSNCIDNVNSVNQTRMCYKYCMSALYPRNNETDPSYGLSRSCYDDMDQEDRENCVDDKNNFCRACNQPKCNTVSMPEMRLSCYVCNGDDCQHPKTEMCRNYRFFDKCYIRYDENHAIMSMGCRSEFSNWEADQLLKQKLLLLCDSDNCNSYENLPSIQQCALCNSRTDNNCSISPSDVKSKTSCRLMPYTQCYTRILTDGATERGCLSDLHDDDFVTCLNGNSSTCESCQGDNCNLNIYPSDRLKCHQCSSENDPLCTTAPNSNKPCLHYKANDSCVTHLHNAVTTRDCASSLQCNDEDNKESCQTCSFDGCNTIDLENVLSEGLPGKWQDIPLTCYTCKNREECQDKGVFRPCLNNPFQNCMTVFSKDGFVIRRGCSDIVKSEYDAYCHNNPEKCMHCNSNGCNLAKSLNEYIECLSCDSNFNSNCIDNVNSVNQTRMCYKYCMSALYPRSNETDPSYGLSRSCYDDMDQEDRENCVDDKNNFCRACNQPKCNTVAMPEMRLSCYVCNGDDCQHPKTEMCRNYRFFDKCYIRYDENHAIMSMGCRSEFSNWEADQLLKQKLLLLCDSDNCNSYENLPSIQQCALCNSRTDNNCSISPSDVKSKTSCRLMPYTQCYTRILTDGATERDCLSNLHDDDFVTCLNGNSSTCESCQGDNCNLNIYPSDRLKCHQCSSENDPLCTTAPNSNKPCLHYKANDSCVTHLHNAVTTRDCASSLQCNDEDNKESCQTCSFDGCNTIDLENVLSEGLPGKWQDIPLTCYTCKNREECQDKGVFRPCLNNPFQNCMTVFSKDGFVIRRGCSDIVKSEYDAYCHNNPEKCMHCNSNGCNLAKSLNEYIECLSCDSNFNSNCIDNVNSVNQTRMCYKYCMSALYPRSNETDPSYGLSRSCYDDMDQEDRENCVDDKNNFCRACNQPKCNTVAMPEMRLSCYVCNGDDCQHPKTEMCRNYRFFDKCYIRYDENHAIMSMGCRSEFSNWEADQLLKQKLLLLCDSDNCNSYENLPSIQQCAICNSRTDSNCSISPSDIKSKTSCRLMPYTQCYTRILTDGATERGCLSNLHDDEFVTCLNGNSSTCESCQGDNCNLNVYPYDRLKCHICDSDENKQCENHPQSLKVCPTYMTDDTCVTTLFNNITHRDCSSSLTCESEDSRLCQKCSGDGCNIVNLAKKQDDNFGKWQTLPLKCFKCKGSECKTLNYTQTEICGPNVAQDCMIVFDDKGEVVRRGCADVVEYEYYSYCEKHKDNCFNCKSNECNSATLKSQFFECIYCDSAKDTDCLWNTSSPVRFCQRGCMTALHSNDKESSSPSYDLIRTCLTDKESDDQDFCAEGSDNYCTACFEPNCNVAIIPDTRLSCYTCPKNTCENPKTHLCSVYKNDDKCFIRFNEENSISEMGCLSSLRNETIEEIIKSKRVALCEGVNCNSLSTVPKAHKCAACNSIDNVFCATSPKEVGSVSQCNMMPYTNCYSKLNNDGTTERGCLSDLPADYFANCLLSNDTNCSICSGDVCNKNIFPEDRQQCYTCSSEHPDCKSFPTFTRPCPIVSATESCITAMNPRNNHTTRGCKSKVYCDENDPTTCRSCFGSKCNAIDLVNRQDDNYHGIWQELPLRCYNCIEENCQDSLGVSITCSSKNINQDCKTVLTTDGKVKRRGCSDDVDDYEDFYCRQHPELCFTCKSNDCNIAWNLTDYKNCLFCDSNNDSKCIHNPDDTNIPLRKCYKDCMVAMRNNQLIRSCLDDKEWQQHEMCLLNNTNCSACSGANCNKFVFPSNRLKCHVCNDQWCSNSTAQYCENYDENDHCFAKYNSVGNIELMGCISSLDDSTIVEWTTQNILYKCKDHECNELSQLPKERTCLKCDSEKTPNCAQQPTQITTIDNCPPANSQCYTRLSSDGHTLRGCSAYLNITEQSCVREGTCTMCSGDKCNDGIFPSNRRQCYICDTTYDNDCAEHPMNPQVCLIYNSNDGCVTKFENGILFRGCTSHITCDPQDKDNCEICHTNGCNTVDLRASSASVKFMQIPILLINLTLIIFHLVY